VLAFTEDAAAQRVTVLYAKLTKSKTFFFSPLSHGAAARGRECDPTNSLARAASKKRAQEKAGNNKKKRPPQGKRGRTYRDNVSQGRGHRECDQKEEQTLHCV
jgi:hypothetical protein